MLALIATAAAPVQKVGYAAPSTPGIGGAFVALILVLGLILGLAWLLKRMPGTGLGLRHNDQLRVVTTLSVGGKERLMVIQVGGEQLLVGVSPGGISNLHRLAEPLVATPAPQLPNFAELLAKRLRKET
jgi:flagellar protein FliO/FliZ